MGKVSGIGAKLLGKFGWRAGDGLGVQRDGMREPVRPGRHRASATEGIGTTRQTSRAEAEQWVQNLMATAYGGSASGGAVNLFEACEGRRCKPFGSAKLARLEAQDQQFSGRKSGAHDKQSESDSDSDSDSDSEEEEDENLRRVAEIVGTGMGVKHTEKKVAVKPEASVGDPSEEIGEESESNIMHKSRQDECDDDQGGRQSDRDQNISKKCKKSEPPVLKPAKSIAKKKSSAKNKNKEKRAKEKKQSKSRSN